MKKTIVASAIAFSVLTTAATAGDFSFGDMFKDMKDATTTMSHDARDTADSMKDGAVETSKSGERTVTSVSHDARDTAVKASDDMKTSEIATVKSGEVTSTSVSRDVRDLSLIHI